MGLRVETVDNGPEDPHSRVGGVYSDTGSQTVLALLSLGAGMDLTVGYRAVCLQTCTEMERWKKTARNQSLACH